MSHVKYSPYEGKALETPLAQIILQPCLPALRPVLQVVHAVRFALSRPLHMKLLPRWLPVIPIQRLKFITYLTYGEILLAIPLVVLFLWGYDKSFRSPDPVKSGQIASYAIFLTFLTANKSNSMFSFIFGVPFERMIPYHRMCAVLAIVLGIFHARTVFLYGEGDSDEDDRRLKRHGTDDENEEDISDGNGSGDVNGGSGGEGNGGGSGDGNGDWMEFLVDEDTNTAGTLLLATMIGLVLLSIFPFIRRRVFDFWLLTHIILASAVIVFCVLHSVTNILFILVWWMLDIIVRYVVMAGCRYPTRANIRKVRPDIVEVSFPKPPGFAYNAGQFVQLAIPSISALQFHPFSISSAPHEDTVTLNIRGLGGWTKQLGDLAERQSATAILLEGPYGCVAIDQDDDKRYKFALLVSGGIGVTHCQSVGKSLLYKHLHRGRELKLLRFVWTVRDLDMVEDMPPLEPTRKNNLSETAPGSTESANDTMNFARNEVTEPTPETSSASPESQVGCTGDTMNFAPDGDTELALETSSAAPEECTNDTMIFARNDDTEPTPETSSAAPESREECTDDTMNFAPNGDTEPTPETSSDTPESQVESNNDAMNFAPDGDTELAPEMSPAAPGSQVDASANFSVVHVDIYTSKNFQDSDLSQMDPSWHVTKGRPNLPKILEEMKQAAIHAGEKHVAVFGCGPTQLIENLKDVCREQSDGVFDCGGVTFDLHFEIFEF